MMNYILNPYKALFILIIVCVSFSVKAQTVTDTTVYTFVDSMPEYPEGTAAMYNFISGKIQYPEIAVENNITGKVYIGLIVEADGSLSNIKTLRGIGSGCDEEAVRVVSLMPNWKPGIHNGENVRVSTTIPFSFQMKPDGKPIYNNADLLPLLYESYFDFDYYIKTNLRFPAGISNKNTIDTVDILYVVETDSSLSNVKLKDSKDKLNAFDYEAIRVIQKLSGKFEPGYIDNKPVRVRLLVSVVFDYGNIDTLECELHTYSYDRSNFSYYKQPKEVFTVVESMPEFPGGMKNLMNFIGDNIRYPTEALNNNEQGRVYINFVVEKDGSISNAKVLRGVSPSIDAEALRLINSLPNWKPGMQRGEPVRVAYNIPVKFSIENGKVKKRNR